MDNKGLGLKQQAILGYFDEIMQECGNKPIATIKELAVWLNSLDKIKTPPTDEQINDVHRIVRNLQKRGLVKTWFITPGSRRVDYKWQPTKIKMVALRDYNGPYFPEDSK